MSDPVEGDVPAAAPEGDRGRTFAWVLLVCAAVPTLAGLMFRMGGSLEELAFVLVFLSPFVYLVFLVVGVVVVRRGRRQQGWGFVFGALAGALVGFGTCLAVAGV
jgi:cytochrome bd-type quinol oxidase subunit 2